jgi:cytochrome P450
MSDANEAAAELSVIFDRMMGLRRRQQLDSDIGRVRAAIRGALPDEADEDDEGVRVALFILGNDTLSGTLGESLYTVLRQNPGRRLNEISYPELPPETGVPFAERVVTEAFVFDGVQLAPGDRVRLYLQGFQYSDRPGDRSRIFGTGLHACLGRQLSVEIWRTLVERLSTTTLALDVLSYAARTDDYVFTAPETLLVGVRS